MVTWRFCKDKEKTLSEIKLAIQRQILAGRYGGGASGE